MKLLYLGTGAAEGVPAIFCSCATCREIRRRGESEWHTRSQLLIDGELSVDFPPDAYFHALKMDVDFTLVKYLLVTHSHMDHFYAHDFILRGYKYADPTFPLPSLTIFGNEEVKKVFDECTRRELRSEIAENIRFRVVRPFEPFSFGGGLENGESGVGAECAGGKGGGGYTAVALKASHGKTECAYVYLLEKNGKYYLHLTDTGRLPAETLDFLGTYMREKGVRADLVTFDCTFLFYEAGSAARHMGLSDNAATKEEFLHRGITDGHTVYAITHYSHNSSPLKETLVRAEEEYGFIAAYDGMTLEI